MLTAEAIWDEILAYQRRIEELERQIARLEPVYRNLGEIKSSFQSARKSTESVFEEKGKWRGEKHTAFCSAGAALDDTCDEYYRRLDAAQDEVNRKIHELEAEKYSIFPLIRELSSMFEQVKANIQNAWN